MWFVFSADVSSMDLVLYRLCVGDASPCGQHRVATSPSAVFSHGRIQNRKQEVIAKGSFFTGLTFSGRYLPDIAQ